MVFGLLGAGLQIAQTVTGLVGQGKAAKEGGGGKAAKPKKPKEATKAEKNPVDRFLKMLDNPNIRSVQDIKGVRDKIVQSLQQKGVKGDQARNAMRKLNQAILKKLGLGKVNQKGEVEVQLNQRTKQVLAQLGMKPDQVKNVGARPPARASAPPGPLKQ